jgi:endonuclease/exonuclease/phosphatase family metal-dependent hydrolase
MLYKARFTDAAINLDPQLAYTFASDKPYQRIDYIFVSSNLRTKIDYVEVPLSTASDHFPVFAVIKK